MPESIKNNKLILNLIFAILTALALISIVQGCRNALQYSQDFQWDAAKALSLHINPYEESLNPTGKLDALGFADYFKQMEANQFPSLLFLLLPFTFFEPMTARILWMITNLVLTTLVIILLRKTFLAEVSKESFLGLSLLMIAGTPWRNQIGVGQHTIFSFFFFLLAVYLTQKKKWLLSGLSLCICYFKYTLTVPLALYFLYKRKWKELAVSVIPHIILTFVAAKWLGSTFLEMIIEPLKVSSALSGEGSLDIGAWTGGGLPAMCLTVILMICLLLLAWFLPKGEDKLLVSLLLIWSLVITYHRSYDYFVLILPYAYLLSNERNQKKERLLICYSVLLAVVFFGLRIFHEAQFSRIIAGIIYYAIAIWFTVIACKKIRNTGSVMTKN